MESLTFVTLNRMYLYPVVKQDISNDTRMLAPGDSNAFGYRFKFRSFSCRNLDIIHLKKRE
jgi:hypothetical protein